MEHPAAANRRAIRGNRTEANLVKVLSFIIASPTQIVGRGERLPQRLKARSVGGGDIFNACTVKEFKM
jgi:hypothetical protein